MMYVDFNTYFEDELVCGSTVEEILEMYNWKKTVKCPCCGKTVSIFEARFNPDYDTVRCAECIAE